MKKKDPQLIILEFNECINNQDINGLTNLMTEDHTFIDSENRIDKGKETMTKVGLISSKRSLIIEITSPESNQEKILSLLLVIQPVPINFWTGLHSGQLLYCAPNA